MENKKKFLFNIIFLILVFGGTLYGVFHGEDLGEIADFKDRESVMDHGGGCLCSDFHLG